MLESTSKTLVLLLLGQIPRQIVGGGARISATRQGRILIVSYRCAPGSTVPVGVSKSLAPGEQIVFKGQFHWIKRTPQVQAA